MTETNAVGALDDDALYHLVTPDEWYSYRASGSITPASLATEGFVHCSWGRQVRGTVDRHFGGVDAVLALRLDPNALDGVPLVEEASPAAGQAFPHAYGPIAVAAVAEVVAVTPAG